MKKQIYICVSVFTFIIIGLIFTKNIFADKIIEKNNIEELVDYLNVSISVDTINSTIIPYQQIISDNSNLDKVSTIFSNNATINKVIELAMTKIGCEYSQEKRELPDIYDCSSFVRRMYKEVTGFEIASNTYYLNIQLQDYKVSFDEIEAGDLVWKEGHIGMYIGNGNIIHSTNYKNYGVCVEPLYGRLTFTEAYRVIDYINAKK